MYIVSSVTGRRRSERKTILNRSFPSSKNSHFQNKAKSKTFLVKRFICMRIKKHFPINGFALGLALKQRLGTTWKWPIVIGLKLARIFLTNQRARENKKVSELQIHCKPQLQTNISVNENTIPVLIGRLSYPIQAAYPSADQQTDLGTSQARLDVDTLNKNTQTWQ